MNATETIGTRRLAWLIAAMGVATLPFVLDLPPWLVLLVVAVAWWRVRGERRGQPGVALRLRLGLLVVTIAALWTTGNLGFGLSAATPAFVSFLWIKLLELKNQRDYQLCCFLACFLVAVALFDEQSLGYCAYALGALGLIAAALARFHSGREHGRVVSLIGVIALQSLPIAVVIFMFFPRLSLPLPSLGGQGLPGFSDRMRPGDIASIATSDRIAFRVEFPEGQPPLPDQLYWRGLVMNESADGSGWRARRAFETNHEPISTVGGGTLVAQDITLMANGQPWLFALESPVVFPEHVIRHDNATVSVPPQNVNHLLRYAIISRVGARPRDPDPWSGHLPQVEPRVRALAAQLDRPGETADQATDRVLGYFHDQGFSYSLSPGQMSDDALGTFLLERRSGFCAHYATAFCALMRLMHHPARVVVGYRGGEMNPYGNFLVVRQEYAHAWAEILEADGSWRRVDPTSGIPIAQGENIPAAQQAATGSLGQALDHVPAWLPDPLKKAYHSVNQWNQYVEARWDGMFLGYDADHQSGFLKWLGLGRLDPPMLLLLVLATIVVLMALTGLFALRPRTQAAGSDRASATFAQFCTRLSAIGVTRQPWEGPIAFTERAAAELPAYGELLRHAGWLYVHLRYGSGADEQATLAHLRRCIRRLPSRPQGRVHRPVT